QAVDLLANNVVAFGSVVRRVLVSLPGYPDRALALVETDSAGRVSGTLPGYPQRAYSYLRWALRSEELLRTLHDERLRRSEAAGRAARRVQESRQEARHGQVLRSLPQDRGFAARRHRQDRGPSDP